MRWRWLCSTLWGLGTASRGCIVRWGILEHVSLGPKRTKRGFVRGPNVHMMSSTMEPKMLVRVSLGRRALRTPRAKVPTNMNAPYTADELQNC